MTTTPTQLDYAPVPQWHQRRRIRLGLFSLLFILACVSGWWWWPQIKGEALQTWLLYRQHDCLVYDPPAGTVVYDENDDTSPSLLGRRGYFVMDQTGDSDRKIVGYEPGPYRKLADLRGGGPPPGSVLFLHERVSSNGKHWLVALYYDCNLMIHPACWYSARSPADWRQDMGSPVWGEAGCEDTRPDPHRRKLLIFAGQADPADRSHFTLAYELAGQGGLIDGRVRDDGSVAVAPVSGPAVGLWNTLQPAPWTRKPLE